MAWETSEGANYVERVTTRSSGPDGPVTTATGSYKITKTRYTNATLLADLVAAGVISSARGYRLVAVRYNVATDSHYETPDHVTDVNDDYYFFAEQGPDDPNPIYLGAERDEMFGHEKFIAFSRGFVAKKGGYVDVFTGDPGQSAPEYSLESESYTGTTLAELTFYRPVAENAYYVLSAEGLCNFSERYDARRGVLVPAGFSGSRLDGSAQGYTHAEDTCYVPAFTNQALVDGWVKFGRPAYLDSMTRYMDQMPGTMETEEEDPITGER